MATAAPLSILVADDHPGVRGAILAALEREDASWTTVEADDGAEALRLGLQLRPAIALLDLHMPHLGGDAVAQTLRQLRPTMRIALHSSDPQTVRDRGREIGVAAFDKLELDRMARWAHGQLRDCSTVAAAAETRRVAPLARRVELACRLCSYGIVTRTPPRRCPMCGSVASWAS